MSFYYSRWRSLTGVEALFSECFAGDDYYVFCAQGFDRAVLDKALVHDLLTGNDKAIIDSFFVKTRRFRGPWNRLSATVLLPIAQPLEAFMEIRNAIAINLEGLGVELCAVAFKRDVICLSQVFFFYRKLQGYENLLCWNGDVLNALRMVLAHVRVYAGRGLYHMDLNCENIMFSGEEVEFVDCEYVLREPVFLSRVLGFKAALLKSYRSIFIAVDENIFLDEFFEFFPQLRGDVSFFSEYAEVSRLIHKVGVDGGKGLSERRLFILKGRTGAGAGIS